LKSQLYLLTELHHDIISLGSSFHCATAVMMSSCTLIN